MTISKILMTVALLAALGFSGVASAHDYLGTLGSAATATDRWYVVCANTARLDYQIQRVVGKAAHVKVTFDSTDIISGPTTGVAAVTAYSPLKTAATVAGAKFFTIKKTAAGAITYRVRLFCTRKNGDFSPGDTTAVQTYVQNQ